MNPLMREIFEAFHDGVAVVSPACQVQYINAAGLDMLNVRPGMPLADAKLAHAIGQVVNGYQAPPVRVPLSIDSAGQVATQATVLRSPVGNDLVVVLRDLVDENFYRTTMDNFHAYVTTDLADPIDKFGARIETVERMAEGLPDHARASLTETATNAHELAAHLRRIKDLAQLFGSAPLMADERLILGDLLEFALAEYASSTTARRVELKFDAPSGEMPPIYGSREWLGRAIAEFLDNAARHTPPEGHVDIRAYATGTHVVLACRNQGPTLGSRNRERLMTPFNAPDGSRPGKPAKAPGGKPAARIGLAICKKILELHGGSVKITDGDMHDIVEFVMELPTGAPTRDSQMLDIAQAQRYASDLARLMQRRAQSARASAPAAAAPTAAQPPKN